MSNTILRKLITNEGASKTFWSLITAFIIGAVAWITDLYLKVQEVHAAQQVQIEKNVSIDNNIVDIKSDLKYIRGSVDSINERLSRR